MKKVLFIGLFMFMLSAVESSAQHYIGLDKDETRKLARNGGFYPDQMTRSQVFNYLKFVNSADTKTLIVFFNENDISTSFKIVCDYSEYDFVRRENDEKFKKTEKNHWEYTKGDDVYKVILEEQDWYFVLRVSKKQK